MAKKTAIIKKLTLRQRRAIGRRYIQGETPEQLAEIYDVKIPTIVYHLKKTWGLSHNLRPLHRRARGGD